MSSCNFSKLAVLGLLVLGMGSCMGRVEKIGGLPAASSKSSAAAPSNRSLDEIMDELEFMTSDKTCYQDSDCKIAQFGVRSCGGAEDVLAYSTVSANAQKVQALVAEYNQVNQKILDSSSSVGTCEVLVLPTLSTCINNGCVEQ